MTQSKDRLDLDSIAESLARIAEYTASGEGVFLHNKPPPIFPGDRSQACAMF